MLTHALSASTLPLFWAHTKKRKKITSFSLLLFTLLCANTKITQNSQVATNLSGYFKIPFFLVFGSRETVYNIESWNSRRPPNHFNFFLQSVSAPLFCILLLAVCLLFLLLLQKNESFQLPFSWSLFCFSTVWATNILTLSIGDLNVVRVGTWKISNHAIWVWFDLFCFVYPFEFFVSCCLVYLSVNVPVKKRLRFLDAIFG